ncbi:MAG: N-6 DNA methylase [Verrucomicrobiota bacterium]|jgi:hypothetical protein
MSTHLMTRPANLRLHEVAFCAEVKSWADALFAQHPEWPFTRASIEEYGAGNYRRQDLRVYREGSNTPVLTGEVKMPGTPEGRSPYDSALMQDAFDKADNVQAPYFFTWNVNRFVLFDRSKYNFPMIERRIRDWHLGLELTSPEDCKRAEALAYIRDIFLPDFFSQFAEIVRGEAGEWGKPPDEIFIHSLESHLDWPVVGTRDYLAAACRQDSAFGQKLQLWMSEEMNWTFDPDDTDNWRQALDTAARTLCYVFSNRAIFYDALRTRYPESLPGLKLPQRGPRGQQGIYDYFRARFHRAVVETGDYEPIFYPQVGDWAGALVFGSDIACQGWKGLLAHLAEYDFRKLPYDIIGHIFQRLISPEERQKFGQFFTKEDIVDIINAFCIRRAGDNLLDPACGSGSFLVRAYHRKAWLSEQRGGRRARDAHLPHQELLREIFGCDIAVFAAHLATLNLAARHIEDEENYPCIARGNFFAIPGQRERFCVIPGLRSPGGGRDKIPVPLPGLDAVVGNPPYVRQEGIPRRKDLKRLDGEGEEAYQARLKTTKDFLQELCAEMFPGLKLSGRSDLHCYFWPVAATFLKEGGYFGFLTSSSWLDVEYGFPLQGWVLKNFKLLAVIESLDEPWFHDARVKTAITILQRCNSETERMSNVVRFVRLLKPVGEILGQRTHGDEAARQNAVECFRRLILHTNRPFTTDTLRIIPVAQEQLWNEGVRAGQLLNHEPIEEPEQADNGQPEAGQLREAAALYRIGQTYVAGKWGRFLRAPDLYFRLIRDYGSRLVRLGEIATIKFGIKSGCDAFFMPRDVTSEVLKQAREGLPWNDLGLMTPCKRAEVESGKVRVVRAGDNTLHPIETEYLRPEVHSLMEVDRPIVRAQDLDRVVLWVHQPLSKLAHRYVGKYIRWGANQTFESEKSRAVTVPQRSTCAARQRWYDLTNEINGVAFWPMTQKYRHIVAANPDKLLCNHRLFYVAPRDLNEFEAAALPAILNSTLVALVKHFYGRYAGSEGTLDTEIIDCLLLEVPNPCGISQGLSKRLQQSLRRMCSRQVTHLVEPALLQCHSEELMRRILAQPPQLPPELQQPDRRELDACVLEMIGVANRNQREKLLDELYLETTRYYRYQRTQDIQAMANRAGNNGRRLGAHDLAESVWHSLSEAERGPALPQWIASGYPGAQPVEIPEGRAQALGPSDLFRPNAVVFRAGKDVRQVDYASPEQAALVVEVSRLGIHGEVRLPAEAADCRNSLAQLQNRLSQAKNLFARLVASRTGSQSLQEKSTSLLLHWHSQGRPPS